MALIVLAYCWLLMHKRLKCIGYFYRVSTYLECKNYVVGDQIVFGIVSAQIMGKTPTGSSNVRPRIALVVNALGRQYHIGGGRCRSCEQEETR